MVPEQAADLSAYASRYRLFLEFRQTLPTEIVSPSVRQLMRFIGRSRSKDGSELDIETVLREALANVIVHGNRRGPDLFAHWRLGTTGTFV